MNNFHTISWRLLGSEELIHYYSSPQGWSDNTGHLNVNELTPVIENEFQKLQLNGKER